MKKILFLVTFLLTTVITYAQRYKTIGIEQYQKNLKGQYVLTARVLNYQAEWTFYSDNTFHCYKEGENCGDYKIQKKTKVGNKTTYTLDLYGHEVKMVIAGNLFSWIEGEDNETKNVYRIVKVLKAE